MPVKLPSNRILQLVVSSTVFLPTLGIFTHCHYCNKLPSAFFNSLFESNQMPGSTRCQPNNIIQLWRVIPVINLLYSIVNKGVTAKINMFFNNVQILSICSYYYKNILSTIVPSLCVIVGQNPSYI